VTDEGRACESAEAVTLAVREHRGGFHGGHLTIANREGGGAIASVWLPATH
jgi:hypothetical protein